MRIERSTGFRLHTGLGLALLLHLLGYLVADYRQMAVKLLAPKPPPPVERPLKFVFLETPESEEEPPPDTDRVAAQRHKASGSTSPPRPDAERDPSAPGERTPAAQPRPPVAQREAPAPRQRPPTRRSEAATTESSRESPNESRQANREAETARRQTPLFTQQALAAAIAQQDFGQPRPSSAPPAGVLDFDAKDFEWGPYAQRIYLIIKRNWYSLLRTQQMAPGMRGRTRLNFRIQRDGQVLQLQILEGCEWEILNRAAQGSVELSDPLPPLPAEFPRQDVGVTFTYYYNMQMER